MPKYTIETIERRWLECTYTIESSDANDAILCVQQDSVYPTLTAPIDDERNESRTPDEISIVSLKLIAEDTPADLSSPACACSYGQGFCALEWRIPRCRQRSEGSEGRVIQTGS